MNSLNIEAFCGILLPFLGTSLGAACVFFMRSSMGSILRGMLSGFAAGVMTAASVWSLLLPAIEWSESRGIWAFFPAVAGFWAGILFLLLLDRSLSPLEYRNAQAVEQEKKSKQTAMMLLAVTLHNIPEGMAVGVVYAGYLTGSSEISAMGALAVSLGIAIQNFPEGAIISMPLKAEGMSRPKAFVYGVLSGAVEPLGAFCTILAAGLVVPALPYLLSFAAGAMIYVVIEELLPEMSRKDDWNRGTLFFAVGFSVMMALDVALG